MLRRKSKLSFSSNCVLETIFCLDNLFFNTFHIFLSLFLKNDLQPNSDRPRTQVYEINNTILGNLETNFNESITDL